MKTILYFLISMIVMVSFSSCNQTVPQRTTTTVTNEKVAYSDQGFMVEQQTVVRGNTVWGISEKVYGTGFKWRDIIALNPFLNTPDRLYYNPERKMWIVRIYPGEVLNIGGQKVYPSCTYESTTTVTTTEPMADNSIMPWWGWMLICLGSTLMLLLAAFQIWGRATAVSSSSSAVFIDVRNNVGIATREALLEREMKFRDDTLSIASKASKNGQLKSLRVREDADYFDLQAKYRKGWKKENKTEEEKDPK